MNNSAPFFRDVHIIFKANAKFSSNVNIGLVAGGHIGLQFGRVAADQIGPLVHIHADAVAQAVLNSSTEILMS